MITALVYSPKYLEHEPQQGHPERPERLLAMIEALKKENLWSASDIKLEGPIPATREDLELVHDRKYIGLVERLSQQSLPLDLDTPLKENTFDLALLAAGGAIRAGELVVKGKANTSFALIRPPGHHAFRGKGGGFCYFNNMAVMIRRLQKDRGLKRVLILDWDCHHGNGTQSIFYGDPTVLYVSLHQDGRTLYPGTGFTSEMGSGEGEGYNVNIPLPSGSSDEAYATAMREIFIPLAEAFKPELVAISAGFDAHEDDPLTGLELSSEAYGWLTSCPVEMAKKFCGGKVVCLLEGGYSLKAMAEGGVNVVRALSGEKFPIPSKSLKLEVVNDLKQKLGRYWPVFE